MENNAVLQNIMTRVSVRSFKNDPVPQEMIEILLRAGMAAPSAKNQQPWSFVVVDQRDVLDRLAAGLRHAKMLENSPLAIVVCADTQSKFWEQDAAAVTENILLAAHALGLGAVWTAASDDRAEVVREVLGVLDPVSPFCVIPIGFPLGEETPKNKWKPEKIHLNRW